MPTISRLLPTITRLPCDYSGHAQGAVREFAYSSGEGVPLVWVADLAAGTPGGAGSEGSRQRRGSASTGENAGGRIKAARGCLYLRRNCPLNARLRFRSILIYPQYKHAVYARFRGRFATMQKIAPENAGTLCGVMGTLRRWAALVRLEARRSCRRPECLQRVQPPTAGAGDTPPSRRQRKAPAGFEPIGAGVHLEFFAASMSIKNGMSRI